MHSAKASASASLPPAIEKPLWLPDPDPPLGAAPALGPEAPPVALVTAGELVAAGLLAFVVVVVPRWATPALVGLPPQAGSKRAAHPARTTLNRTVRGRLVQANGVGGLSMGSVISGAR